MKIYLGPVIIIKEENHEKGLTYSGPTMCNKTSEILGAALHPIKKDCHHNKIRLNKIMSICNCINLHLSANFIGISVLLYV